MKKEKQKHEHLRWAMGSKGVYGVHVCKHCGEEYWGNEGYCDPKKIIKKKVEWKKKRGKHICMLCGQCVVSCPNGAIRFNKSSEDLTYDDEIIIDHSKCSGCGECVKVCPEIGSMIRIIKDGTTRNN